MKEIRRVGFVGLGRMGYPMAGHLARAGFELRLYDVRLDIARAFVAEHGGTVAENITAVGETADAVITMLPTSSDVRAAVLGDNGKGGVAGGLGPGSVIIDMGTSDPVQTRILGDALHQLDIHLVDAPVSGGVVYAKDASLDIMTGGAPEVVARCRPVFEVLGRHIHDCGELGNAHAMKVINNFVNATSLITLIEALSVGRRLGLDLDMMLESIAAATTERNHPLAKKVIPHVLSRRFDAGASISLIAKDVGIAVSSAKALDAFAPVAECCGSLWDSAAAHCGGERDQTEIVRMWEDHNGVKLEYDVQE